jgi:hypothetical protein
MPIIMAKKKKYYQLQIPFTNEIDTNSGQFDPSDNGLKELLFSPIYVQPIRKKTKNLRKTITY